MKLDIALSKRLIAEAMADAPMQAFRARPLAEQLQAALEDIEELEHLNWMRPPRPPKPVINDRVVFNAGGEGFHVPHAAIVIYVHRDGMLNLSVCHPFTGAWLLMRNVSEGTTFGTWQWPPP